ncbi:MAG: hypothetical protein M9887_03510 [Chitinophagales bacterium]|nr:hypothetical protein [Chitinophagales bacterium]
MCIFCNISNAQNKYATLIAQHIERLNKDSLVSEDFIQNLQQIETWLEQPDQQVSLSYFNLLDKYLTYIRPSTFKTYNKNTHEDIIDQSLNILKAASSSTDMRNWTYSLLPEYYSAVKTLIPDTVFLQATMDMAQERPQELIGQFSKLFYTTDTKDLEKAIISSPNSITMLMHYNNLAKSALNNSSNDTIRLILNIYNQYRYNPNPYILLPYILQKKLSPQQANEIAQNKSQLLKYLLPLLLNNEKVSVFTLQQKWNDISAELLTAIRKYRLQAPKEWKLEMLDSLPIESITQILFYSHNILNPVELEAFTNWIYYKNAHQRIRQEVLDKIPLDKIIALKNRIEQETLKPSIHLLWEDGNWLSSYIQKKLDSQKPNDKLSPIQAGANLNRPVNNNLQVQTQKVPERPKYIIQTYNFHLSQSAKDFIKWKSSPYDALEKINEWIDSSFALDLLKYIADRTPLDLIKNTKKIVLKKQGIQALEYVAKVAPFTVKNFVIQPSHYWNTLFKDSKNAIIQLIYKINAELGSDTKAYLLINDIYKEKISIQEAENICSNKQELVERMIHILADTNAIGRFSMEQYLSSESLKFVRNLNISENTDKSFTSQIQEQTPEALYTFMTYGEDEIIYSSFAKMLDVLIDKSPQSNIYPTIKNLNFNNFRKFARKCVDYNLFDKVYNRFTESQKEETLDFLIYNIEKSVNSENEAIQVADMILGLKNNSLVLEFQKRLQKEYGRVESIQSDEGVAIYGILSTLIAKKVNEGEWAKYVAEKYKLPNLERLPAYTLFNQKMENIQQYYFYNDQDGNSSYNNFIKSYERSPLEWEIKDYGKFICISSKTGKRVEIFANKAAAGEEGIKDMQEYMSGKGLEPQIVVHRGLSTHTLKTFTRIPQSAKLILDGSCGGYHVQSTALKRAPNAQILCNRNIGTMFINDPMFKQINDDIRNGKDLDWDDFWYKMNKRVGSNPYFKDYIPPHKNASAILIRALYDILEIH